MTPEQLSEYLRKTLNTFLNPTASSTDIFQLTGGQRPFVDVLGHAGGLALGYGAMGALLMALLKKRHPEGLPSDALKSMTNVEYSPVSLDPDLGDVEQEREERARGLKQAEEEPGTFGVTRKGYGKTPYYHLALALAGAVGGGALGARSMAQFLDQRKEKELESKIEKQRNVLDKILYEEYMRTHQKTGQEKEAGFGDWIDEQGASLMEWYKRQSPGVQELLGPFFQPGKTFYGVRSMWGIYAVASLAAGYATAKSLASKHDPARERASRIEAFSKRRDLSNAPPQLVSTTKFPIAKEKAAKPPKTGSPVPVV